MPGLMDINSKDQEKISKVMGTIEKSLKIFEVDRVSSFKSWAFDENEKCSVSEVKNLNFFLF